MCELDVISSRGEGLDFLSLLQSRRMLEAIKYERRFKTTLFHVLRAEQLRVFAYPEISPFNHAEFEDKLNYVYLVYALRQLIAMPHLQILQKVLTFLYYNEDFFNGAHRLLVRFFSFCFSRAALPRGRLSELRALLHALEPHDPPPLPPPAALPALPHAPRLPSALFLRSIPQPPFI